MNYGSLIYNKIKVCVRLRIFRFPTFSFSYYFSKVSFLFFRIYFQKLDCWKVCLYFWFVLYYNLLSSICPHLYFWQYMERGQVEFVRNQDLAQVRPGATKIARIPFHPKAASTLLVGDKTLFV